MRTILLAVVISLLTLHTTHASDNGVTQAVITTGVTSGAEPQTSNLSVIDYRVGTVTFYTEINGLQGKTVTHRWYYDGQEMSSITIQLGSNQSINWSRSTIAPSQLGSWEARVVDERGRVLASRSFSVVQSRQSTAAIVQQQQIDACSVRLAQLEQQMNENPTVEYYKFLYDRQVQRCNDN